MNAGVGPLPMITEENESFWRGGARGRLMITRCAACGYYIHPSGPVCPKCWSWDVVPSEVCGQGSIYSFTTSHREWFKSVVPPYVLAVVALPEQRGLRLTTRLVDVDIDAVHIGMSVRVVFERAGDIWRPLFTGVDGKDA